MGGNGEFEGGYWRTWGISDLNFGWKSGCKQGDFVRLWDTSNEAVDHEVINGTFTCGIVPSAEMFSKPLYEGWNLISLPLVPADNSTGAVLSGVPYDAV